jgi:hypothetical protein
MLERLGQEPFLPVGNRGDLRQRLLRDLEVELCVAAEAMAALGRPPALGSP